MLLLTERLSEKLDALLTAHRSMILAEVNASACGTTYDSRQRDKKTETYLNLLDEYEGLIKTVNNTPGK